MGFTRRVQVMEDRRIASPLTKVNVNASLQGLKRG